MEENDVKEDRVHEGCDIDQHVGEEAQPDPIKDEVAHEVEDESDTESI